MNEPTTPTLVGQRRYPATGGYYDAGDGDPQPCTCTDECAGRCSGSCGCPACSLAFVEFCDVAGLYSNAGMTVSEEEAVRLYQQGRG